MQIFISFNNIKHIFSFCCFAATEELSIHTGTETVQLVWWGWMRSRERLFFYSQHLRPVTQSDINLKLKGFEGRASHLRLQNSPETLDKENRSGWSGSTIMQETCQIYAGKTIDKRKQIVGVGSVATKVGSCSQLFNSRFRFFVFLL